MPPHRREYLSDVWRDGIFDGKVVFCTGGAGTICSAQVRALVRLGADACIVGRNPEKTKRMAADIATAREGAKVIGIGNVDVRIYQGLRDAAQECVEKLGSLDFCIAGAAGNFLAPIHKLSPNAFKSVVDIDVLGSYNTVKATLPFLVTAAAKSKTDEQSDKELLSKTGGRIIFVSATMHYAGTAYQVHASAAKAAVDALSNGLAIELGPRGVTSNVIAPGPIAATEGIQRLTRVDVAQASKRVPVGKFGSVKDIADATVYLFSDTGDFVNGEVLVVDGGAWRTSRAGGSGSNYPDDLLADDISADMRATNNSKL